MSKPNLTSCERHQTQLRFRQEAEDESAYAAYEYRRQRPYLESGSERVIELARLDYLYHTYYPSLNDLFSAEEIARLLVCFRGEILTRPRVKHMDSIFQFDSIFSGTWLNPGEELLCEKIRCLSLGQRLTLADTLEQLWYRAPDASGQGDLLAELGITLRQ